MKLENPGEKLGKIYHNVNKSLDRTYMHVSYIETKPYITTILFSFCEQGLVDI